eukprot:SAG11_NODE_31479_length_291_cov_1.083333_1_plen_66_part_10
MHERLVLVPTHHTDLFASTSLCVQPVAQIEQRLVEAQQRAAAAEARAARLSTELAAVRATGAANAG